jgi:ubiquinone/menaquinone biosynthesis C-methylase UbiE
MNYDFRAPTSVTETETHHISACKQQWDFSTFKAKRVFLPRLSRIRKYIEPGPLLDIGCANGAFVKVANSAGWKGQGIELREASAQVARSHGITVYTEPLEELGLHEKNYSAITMWQVLEHLEDPCRMLAECNRIMKMGGVLAFSTPNARSIGWILLKEGWPAIDPRAHFNLFHSVNLERLLKRFGFAKCEVSHLDLHPATIKQLKNKLLRQRGKCANAAAILASRSSERKMKAMFFARQILNFPLDIFRLGEDIYGYFRKISSC